MGAKKTLDSLRSRIDDFDNKILQLLNQRAQAAKEIAKLKNKSKAAIYNPSRESSLLKRLKEANEGGKLPNDSIEEIFREIISACRGLEQEHKVAYLGPQGTFTHEAAKKKFGHAVKLNPMRTIDDVFNAVAYGEVDYGVVPVENTVEGLVTHTLDSFLKNNLVICDEIVLWVHIHLMALRKAKKGDIEIIYAHQHALGQCRYNLEKKWPNAKLISMASNSAAAKEVGRGKSVKVAALASEVAAETYKLRILERNLQENSKNNTRFLVIGKGHDVIVDKVKGKYKTSVILATKNETGALYKILRQFYKYRVNLTRLDSLPSRGDRENYYFFIDFETPAKAKEREELISGLKTQTTRFQSIGTYPRAD